MTFLEGYKQFKDVQGKEYNSVPPETKNRLREFREILGKFTDSIFDNTVLVPTSNGKGMWQNSGNFSRYMWNRYQLDKDNKSHLVIYFYLLG